MYELEFGCFWLLNMLLDLTGRKRGDAHMYSKILMADQKEVRTSLDEHSEKARAPYTHEPRDVSRCPGVVL
jgi:hypothetical protein